jgi:hypothetical protein
VDAAVAERQKAIDNARTAADCANVLANVRTFRSHPGSLQRQLATSAEQKARTLGCDESAIQSAIAEGDQRVWREPPKPKITDAPPVGSELPDLSDLEVFKPTLTMPKDSQQQGGQGGQGGAPGAGGDCSHCYTNPDTKDAVGFLTGEKNHCSYHPNRLAMFCDPDPECVHWRDECARQRKIFDECMAECSG